MTSSEIRESDLTGGSVQRHCGNWRSPRWYLEMLGLAIVVAVGGWAGTYFTATWPSVSGFWPSAGIAFAGLWRFGLSRWPGVVLGLLSLALVIPVPLGSALCLTIGDSVAAFAAVWCLRRVIDGREPFERTADVARFLVVGVVGGPMISAWVGASSRWLLEPGFSGHFREYLWIRWLSHGVGVLLLSPALLCWWPTRKFQWSRVKWMELLLFVGAQLALGAWVFARPAQRGNLPIPDAALIVPLFLWAVTRWGRRGTTLTMLSVGLMTLTSAWNELGPFPRAGGFLMPSSVVLALGNVSIMSAAVLLMSVLQSQYRAVILELQKAEVRYRILFEHSPDAVFVVGGPDERLLEFNDRLPELLGQTREQLAGRRRAEFELNSPQLSMGSSIQSVYNPKTSDFDAEYRRIDGASLAVNVTYSAIEFSGNIAYLMIARDVTARRREEQRLRESELRFRTLADSIPVMVAIQRDGVASYVNSAAIRISGRSGAKLIHRDFVNLLHPRHQAAVREAAEKCVRGELPTWRREVTLLCRHGQERRLDLSLAALPWEGQSAWLVSAMDVTERREADEQLRQLTAELFHASRLRLQGEMVAGVAHEFRHPVGAIANTAQGLVFQIERGQPLPEARVLAAAREILGYVDRALATIARLRDLSQPHELNRQPMDLSSLISDATKILKLDHRWSGVTVHLDSEIPPPLAAVDRHEMTQVLLNLLRNALEATERLPIELRHVAVELRRESPDWLRLSVKDNGPGVPDGLRETLFTPFHTNKTDGMGLGLSLCQKIVRLHDGNLTYEPGEDDCGAKFHIRLPSQSA